MNYAEQLTEWQARLDMLDKHIALGQRLSEKASRIMDEIDLGADMDVKELATLIKAASDAVTKGAKLEADSREKRLILLLKRPPEF